VGSASDSPHNSPSASPTPVHPGNLRGTEEADTARQELGLDVNILKIIYHTYKIYRSSISV